MTIGSESSTLNDVHARQREWLAVPLLLCASVLLCGIVYLQVFWPGIWTSNAVPLSWAGESFSLTKGRGYYADRKLIIEAPNDQGVSVAAIIPKTFHAADYSTIKCEIVNSDAATEMVFLWRTADQPGRFYTHLVPVTKTGMALSKLADDENWRGEIVGLALLVKGQGDTPITLTRLSLQPVNISQILKETAGRWFAVTGWSASSINFVNEEKTQSGLSFTVSTCIVVVVALVLYLSLIGLKRLRPNLIVAWCLVLAGWFALDAVWQWNLIRRVSVTWQQYAGKSSEDKHLAAEDGFLFRFITHVNQALPPHSRILYFSDDSYAQWKGAYFLYPHNVLGGRDLPNATDFHSGDFVVLFRKQNAQFDPARKSLVWPAAAVGVDVMFAEGGNYLLKVQ